MLEEGGEPLEIWIMERTMECLKNIVEEFWNQNTRKHLLLRIDEPFPRGSVFGVCFSLWLWAFELNN